MHHPNNHPARRAAFALTLSLILALPALAAAKPTLWIIGDSTVRNHSNDQVGWGSPLAKLFDPGKIEVLNRAIGGRSSRTFFAEGRWDAVYEELRPGDFLLIQFGHNDGGEIFSSNRPRGSLKGVGDESRSGVVAATGQRETVRSFGWYIRNYCAGALHKGATPIVLSPTPRNRRDSAGKIITDETTFALWARHAAAQAGAYFIAFNALLAARYDQLGPATTATLFSTADNTHTNSDGAAFNASVLAAAIRELPDCRLGSYLLPTLSLSP